MTMQLSDAFDADMLTEIKIHSILKGHYNNDNDWIEGAETEVVADAIVVSGNKFTQFDEGTARHDLDGGVRYTNFKTVSIGNPPPIDMNDKIEYRGFKYTIIQSYGSNDFGFIKLLVARGKHDDES